MTDAPAGPVSTAVPVDGSDGAPVETDEAIVVRRPGRRRKEQRRLALAQGVVVALLVVGLVALGAAGYRSALRITGGGRDTVTDPALPGYTAEVRPTPVDLVAFTSPEGRLTAAALVVGGPGGKGGTLVPVPSTLALWNYEDSPPASAFDVFADGGIDALRARLGSELTFGLTGASTVPSSALRVLAQAAGPVTVELSEPVLEGSTDADQQVKYPAGTITFDPVGFEEFVTFAGYREPEVNRVLRSQQAWAVLLRQLGAELPGASATEGTSTTLVGTTAPGVPELGESAGSGEPPFQEVLGALLAGEVRFDGLPLERLPLNNIERAVLYRVDQAAMPKWVPQVVPFPTSAFPGQRAKVRLLRGTPDKGVLRAVSPKVVEAGGEVTAVGNARSFDLATSQVRYQNPDAKDAATVIAELLGAQVEATPEDLGDVDVEVVVGSDLAG
ncbi:MAG: LytR C-terminal domain-containing protein [Actinomycetes bacterium]